LIDAPSYDFYKKDDEIKLTKNNAKSVMNAINAMI